jgi:aminopeptidase 2
VFNSSGLVLGNAALYSGDLKFDSSLSPDDKQERRTLRVSPPPQAGSKAQLHISFQGKLTDSMVGYYRSSYQEDGKDKYYALTQFEVGPMSDLL